MWTGMCVNSACMYTNTTRYSINFPLNKPSPTLIWTHLQLHSHIDCNIYQRESLLIEMTESFKRRLSLYHVWFIFSVTRWDQIEEREVRAPPAEWEGLHSLSCVMTPRLHADTAHRATDCMETQRRRDGVSAVSLWSSQMSDQDWCIVQHSVYCRLMGAEDVWSALILLLYLRVSVASVPVSTGVFS